MEEVVAKVMKVDKAIKLFQTMSIMSINMGNLIVEVNSLKNRLATWEKENDPPPSSLLDPKRVQLCQIAEEEGTWCRS